MNPSPSRHAAAFTVILLALGFLAGCAPAHIGTTVSASLAENQGGSTVVVGCSGQQQNPAAAYDVTKNDYFFLWQDPTGILGQLLDSLTAE